jgi:hypothetical protein
MAQNTTTKLSEIDEIGWVPLRPGATTPPAPGFQLQQSLDIHDLIVYRFISPTPRAVAEQTLIGDVLTLDQHAEVLVPGSGALSVGAP